jgi:hypothetical protein
MWPNAMFSPVYSANAESEQASRERQCNEMLADLPLIYLALFSGFHKFHHPTQHDYLLPQYEG